MPLGSELSLILGFMIALCYFCPTGSLPSLGARITRFRLHIYSYLLSLIYIESTKQTLFALPPFLLPLYLLISIYTL